MSAYAVSTFCHRLTVDPQHRHAAQNDLQAAMAPFDLTSLERQAIENGDVGYLYWLGVHPLLLVRLQIYGVAELTEVIYSTRMRAWAGTVRADGRHRAEMP